jgi:hypothetical protein
MSALPVLPGIIAMLKAYRNQWMNAWMDFIALKAP